MPTLDHIDPRSRGGQRTQFVCEDGNHVKGDMTFEQWTRFMAVNPRWWVR